MNSLLISLLLLIPFMWLITCHLSFVFLLLTLFPDVFKVVSIEHDIYDLCSPSTNADILIVLILSWSYLGFARSD